MEHNPTKKPSKIAVPFHDWKIRKKLISVALFLVLLPLLIVVSFSLARFNDALKKGAEEDLEHLVRNIYALCKTQQEMMPKGTVNPPTGRSSNTLKEEIRQNKVGDTGYAFTIDSRGILRVHPAKEGENILDSTDSAGFKYIRAMIKEALVLGDGKVGTIRYPWMNPELGETKPRQKLAKFIYFKPWDWIISAGAYEGEIYHSLYETERFIFIVIFVSLAIAVVLTVVLSNFLTGPILDLTRVTTGMSSGDLSHRVIIKGKDEIGTLGESFNLMAEKIQNYTSNLENLVELRTRDLMESRERYRSLSHFLTSILESPTQYGIIAMDVDGTITEFNKGAEKLLDWRKEEVIHSQNIAVTFLPSISEKEIGKTLLHRIRTEGLINQEMDRVRKNGERFPASSSLTAIADLSGEVRGFVEIIRNITLRKTLEKELRETKEFLENIMESSVDGIVTTDLKGKITYLNRAIAEMLEYQKSELLGYHISMIYVRGIQEAWDIMNLLGADERIEHYEMEVKGKTGEVLTILTSASLLRDEEDKVIGTSGIFKNITEQKRLEAKLKETQFYLVEASKMRALGELVAGVAHELNNPLMASQTIFHVIQNNLHEDCPNQERLELIGKCNDRIEKIVNHLREFSRQTESDFQEVDMNQPIENALLLTGQQLLNHNITITRKLSENLPKINGDTNQLEQVFLNLISNARDAMDTVTGPKELTIHSYLQDEDESPSVVVSVKDTGEGIPEEILSKVLEPFFSTKPVGKGTGLGLSLCFGIVEAHEGRLEIKSQVGVGTEVKILFPVKPKI